MSRVFLDLLAREASPVEFEAPILEARAAGAGPEALAELEAEKRAALQVRAALDRRARREAELSALFETAGDLAGLRDLDAVLEAIVRRTRRLLNTDTSYMTLLDEERGDTYMRVTDGSVSAAFRRLRLPLGAGLGGLVAQTATPYTSTAYLTDGRFNHTDPIDTAVAEEGLVSILGAPMRLGSRVIGVLFAANRTDRPFVQEEVALICSLAAHAAVAIDNARLLAETRVALEELGNANAEIRARGAAVERAAQAHDRMTGLVVRGGGVEDVAAVAVDLLGGTLFVLDADGRQLAAVGPVAPMSETETADAAWAASASAGLGRMVQRGGLHVVSVAAGTETLGTLVLRTTSDLDPMDQRILERAGLVTALLLLFRRSVAEAEGRVRGELLDDLLTGRVTDSEALRTRAKRLGVDTAAPHVVVVARHGATEQSRAAFWASSHAMVEHGLAATRGNEVILLLPGSRPGAVARQVAKELSTSLGLPATAGAAGPVRELAGVLDACLEARRCMEALEALGRVGGGGSADELGFVGLLIGDDRDVAGFLQRTLGPVLDYDRRRGTELVETLRAYFGTGSSLTRTADRLHIHVNTVTQRLDRVARLLGADWQDPDHALELQLALRLHRLHA